MYPSSPDICCRDSALRAKLSLCCSQAAPSVSPLQAVCLPPKLPMVTASSLDSHKARHIPGALHLQPREHPGSCWQRQPGAMCLPTVAQAMTKLPSEKLCEGRNGAEGHLRSKDISLIPHSVKERHIYTPGSNSTLLIHSRAPKHSRGQMCCFLTFTKVFHSLTLSCVFPLLMWAVQPLRQLC